MKRALLLFVLVLALVGCVANPAIRASGNGVLLQINLEGLQKAIEFYLYSWGPYSVINTHLCGDCDGKVLLIWLDAQDEMAHYVMIERFNGTWVIVGTSE